MLLFILEYTKPYWVFTVERDSMLNEELLKMADITCFSIFMRTMFGRNYDNCNGCKSEL